MQSGSNLIHRNWRKLLPLAIVLIGVCVWLARPEPNDIKYQGKWLSEYVEDLPKATLFTRCGLMTDPLSVTVLYDGGDNTLLTRQQTESMAAIQGLGDESLPYLFDTLTAPETVTDKIPYWITNIPVDWVRRLLFQVAPDDGDDRRERALTAILELNQRITNLDRRESQLLELKRALSASSPGRSHFMYRYLAWKLEQDRLLKVDADPAISAAAEPSYQGRTLSGYFDDLPVGCVSDCLLYGAAEIEGMPSAIPKITGDNERKIWLEEWRKNAKEATRAFLVFREKSFPWLTLHLEESRETAVVLDLSVTRFVPGMMETIQQIRLHHMLEKHDQGAKALFILIVLQAAGCDVSPMLPQIQLTTVQGSGINRRMAEYLLDQIAQSK